MKFNDLVHKVKDTLLPGGGQEGGRAEGELARETLDQRPAATPDFDAYENDVEWVLRADVPGAGSANTKVWYDEREGLSLHVQNRPPAEDARLIIGDAEPCDWYCAIPLPDYLDGERATSDVERGVLTIKVPKREASQPKAIPIEFNA